MLQEEHGQVWASIPGALPCPTSGWEASPEESGPQALVETSQALGAKQLPGNEGGGRTLLSGQGEGWH